MDTLHVAVGMRVIGRQKLELQNSRPNEKAKYESTGPYYMDCPNPPNPI